MKYKLKNFILNPIICKLPYNINPSIGKHALKPFSKIKIRVGLKIIIIKPAGSAGFSRIRKMPYQAPPTQLGPRKCTFWKNAYQGWEFNFFFGKFKELPGATS